MSKTIIPANYTPALNLYDTQRAIGTVKRLFADTLCATLNLYRVSAPLFVEASTGLNDDLNGVERKVTFDMKDGGIEAQVVQSLAKWKRKALKDYGFRVGKGLYCDMNAIRRDEDLDLSLIHISLICTLSAWARRSRAWSRSCTLATAQSARPCTSTLWPAKI